MIRSLREVEDLSDSDSISVETAGLSDYQWESSLIDVTNLSPGGPDLLNRDDPLVEALQKLMNGPLAPPRRTFPSSVYTESISNHDFDNTPGPSPPLQHVDSDSSFREPSILHRTGSDLRVLPNRIPAMPTSVILPSPSKTWVCSIVFYQTVL